MLNFKKVYQISILRCREFSWLQSEIDLIPGIRRTTFFVHEFLRNTLPRPQTFEDDTSSPCLRL